ncbi:hypothetical protein NX059_001262 [Plenodomus lindquistii]|nr:hypothetical protein NX059_001262 [Plenodomus lindquistii]
MSFINKSFYLFECISQPGYTISSGKVRDSNGTLAMTIRHDYSSSENWQLFLQQDRYFVRNFDYAAGFQLGLTEDDLITPRLYARSGSLGQQWNIVSDGIGYRLSNGLLGNTSWLALPDGKATPSMQKEGSGLMWNITRNPR